NKCGSARVVQRVGGCCKPPRVIASGYDEASRRADIHAAAQVMDVSPADLIGEAELVVSGRIQLVERLPPAIVAIVVAGAVVVVAEDARLAARRGNGESCGPMARPRPNGVGANRAELRRYFTARVGAAE